MNTSATGYGRLAGSAAAADANDWEHLRRQARQLENDVDARLVAYAKLASGTNAQTSDRLVDMATGEIEELLRKLGHVVDAMGNAAVDNPSAPPSMQNALQRHRDIHRDFTVEFRKTRQRVMAHREQTELLSSVRSDIDAYKASQRSELLMSEREHIDRSHQMTGQILEYAFTLTRHLVCGSPNGARGAGRRTRRRSTYIGSAPC